MTEQDRNIEATENTEEFDEHNIFKKPWNDSDVVLVVEDKEFYVHRFILSLQSPVFKAMFNGNFKDATQDKIELKDENYQAMLDFLKLLYPSNMLDDYEGKVDINDDNILQILEVADKYGAKNIIKQCAQQTQNLKPENTMRLLPYVARHNLPLENIFDVISRRVSTKTLENFAPELRGNDSLYDQCLLRKCRLLENAAKQANTFILHLLPKYIEKSTAPKSIAVKCIQHEALCAKDLKRAIKCEYCLKSYKKFLINEDPDEDVCEALEVCLKPSYRFASSVSDVEDKTEERAFRNNCIDLLKLTDDFATSLQN